MLVHQIDRCSLSPLLAWCILTNLQNEIGYVFSYTVRCLRHHPTFRKDQPYENSLIIQRCERSPYPSGYLWEGDRPHIYIQMTGEELQGRASGTATWGPRMVTKLMLHWVKPDCAETTRVWERSFKQTPKWRHERGHCELTQYKIQRVFCVQLMTEIAFPEVSCIQALPQSPILANTPILTFPNQIYFPWGQPLVKRALNRLGCFRTWP